MQKQQSLIGHVFNDQYTIVKKLKSGGFGSVYWAKDNHIKNRFVAIKISDKKSKFYAEMELKMYQKIKQNNYTHGFVKHYHHGLQNNSYFLILQLLDKDLDEVLYKMKNNSFTLKTVVMIGLQMIDRLQAFHKIGYLHRDIKPDNIAIGFQEKNKIIYLIDFGLAKKIEEVRKQEVGKLVGSLGYMSCRAHQGKQTGPADDIQSLIYTMLALLEGSLPWSRLKINTMAETHKILIMKKKLTRKDFKTNIPEELFLILEKIKKTPINEKVDYLKMKFHLINILKNIKAENDFMFDWANIRSFSPQKKGKARNISPQKLERQKEKEENQKEIQKQIYQVYKFLQRPDQDAKSRRELSKEKQRKNKNQNSRQKQPSIGAKRGSSKQILHNQVDKKRQRPVSALNIKRVNQFANTKDTLSKINQLYGQIKYEAPNIVINKTAKHKI